MLLQFIIIADNLTVFWNVNLIVLRQLTVGFWFFWEKQKKKKYEDRGGFFSVPTSTSFKTKQNKTKNYLDK